MKRFFTALLTAALLLGGAASFSSCGSSLPAKQRVDHVYRVSTVRLDENFRIRRLFSAGGKQYVNVIVSYPDVDETEELIYEISADERRLKPSGFTIYTPENGGNNRFSMNAAYCREPPSQVENLLTRKASMLRTSSVWPARPPKSTFEPQPFPAT